MLTLIYWVGFILSVVATAAFLMFYPAWFWVMLPFVFTFFVKALDWI